MAGIREGYLLHLDAQNDNLGDIHYAALEEGMLKMYSSPDRQDAHLILSVSLARHSVEVDMVPFSDGNGLPCRFFVHLTPYVDSSTPGDKEQIILFSAPTAAATTLWSRALLNWQRHSFDSSFRSLPLSESDQAAIAAQRMSDLRQLEERVQQYDLVPRASPKSPSGQNSIWTWVQGLISQKNPS